MNQSMDGRPVSGVLQPHVRLQLMKQGLDDEALPQQELVHQGHKGTSKNAPLQEREVRFTRKGAGSSARGTLMGPVMSRGD